VRHDVALAWLAAVEATGVNLTDWEETFVASLRAQASPRRPFSDAQLKALERIYATRTP
jgi:hypothetical protein